MRRIILSIWFLICLAFFAHSQKEANIWYFSQSGLDFNYKPARVLTNSKINGFEGTASIADTLGNLLFYTDGDTVWNRFHEIIQGGMGIGGYHSNSCPSAPLIVRLPNSYRYYYVFTATDRTTPALEPNEVRYSIIDIEQNGGKGRVISQRNVLVKNSAEKIAAVLHGNKRDVWIAVKQNLTDTLFVFKLTPAGLSSTIIKNKTYKDSITMTGQMKFSPNGKYLALGNGGPNKNLRIAYLYNFDRYSGTLNGERKIMVESNGVEFSPNSRYLYLSNIYQIPIDKISKIFYLDSTMYIGKNPQSYAMQLAPDGKLYICTNDSFLHVVEYPNLKGKNCGFKYKEQVMYVKNKPFNSTSIPVFLASYFQTEAFNVVKTCIGKPVNFILSEAYKTDSVYWDFGDTASHDNNTSNKITNITHIYKQYGNYTVKLVTFYDNRSDTTTAVVSFKNPKPDFTALDVCENDSAVFINKSEDADEYLWKFGDGQYSKTALASGETRHKYQITQTTTFLVTLVAKSGCSDSVTNPITVNQNPNSDFTSTQNGDKLTLKAQSGYSNYKWKFNNADSITVTSENYIHTLNNYTPIKICLQITDINNCTSQTCKTIPLGVKQTFKPQTFKLYPNPNSGTFTIETQNIGTLNIQIFDVLGREVAFEKVQVSDNKIKVYLAKVESIYTVKLKQNGVFWVERVVVGD